MIPFVKKASDFLTKAFPTPLYLSLNPAGIDITHDAIYFMKLKKVNGNLIPDKFEKIPFEKHLNLDQSINTVDRATIITSLKKLKQKYKLEYVMASLPEHETYIFKTVIPKASKSDIPSFIRYQIEENVPMAAIDVNFYYLVTGPVNKVGDMGVVVSVFPKKITNFYTDIFTEAGLYPISFFAESRALFYSTVKDGDLNPYLIVRILPHRVAVSILEGGVIQYTSDIQLETEKIMESFESPEAVSLKEELNKVLIYWFTSKKDFLEHKKIENVILAGHNADEQKMIDFLEKALKIHVQTGNVWTNCFDIKKITPTIDKKTALTYAVAIGLARRCVNYA